MEDDRVHCMKLRETFLEILCARLPGITINGDAVRRLPGNLNLRFPGIDADSLLMALRGQVSASTGSACNAGLIEPSYVLLALGLNMDQVKCSIRFSFGRYTTVDDIVFAAECIYNKVISFSEQLIGNYIR